MCSMRKMLQRKKSADQQNRKSDGNIIKVFIDKGTYGGAEMMKKIGDREETRAATDN